MSARRGARWTGTVAALAAAAALAGAIGAPAWAQRAPARDTFGDAGKVRGPLSDFWFKVRSEWSGYTQSENALPEGGGYVRNRTLMQPSSTSVWVSLVHADLGTGGRKRSPLAQLQDEFLAEWKHAEGLNWPYAQIYARPWERMGANGRRQNIIMIGTPWTLPPVGPLAESLGFRISPGRIEVGRRRYHGDNLVLVFIAPNPADPARYALVITGSGEEALFQAGHVPYGETDYVIFRGRHLLESGHFDKPSPQAWGPPRRYEAVGSHRGFAIRESAHYTFWYEKERLTPDEIDALVREKEAVYPALRALLPPLPAGQERLTWFLYPSVDRKIDETQRDEVSHVDWAAGEIHTVFARTQKLAEPWLDLMILLHRAIGPTRVPRLERALALALSPDFQGRDITVVAGPIFHELRRRESAVLRSLRDQDVMTPADGPPGPHDLLLAAFLKDCITRRGRDRALSFVREASPRTLEDVFEDRYDLPLGEALDQWAAGLAGPVPSVAMAASSEAVPEPGPTDAGEGFARARALLRDRHDEEAARLLEPAMAHAPSAEGSMLLARALFRRGDLDGAARAAEDALRRDAPRAASRAETAGWSRLTLGRVEALRGRHLAARAELTHPEVTGAPAPVPTLAAYWLETMGESRNQLTVVSHLKDESRVALRKLDWRTAEAELRRALEIDPSDGEAHKLLSDVYHRQHEYWAWQIRYLNQTHPDYNVLSRTFFPGEATPLARVELLHTLDSFNDLVLRGNLELMKAQTLYAAEIQNLHAEGDRFLIEKRDIPEALAAYRRALELNEDFFLSHFLVARCYFLMDRFDAARASFNQVLQRRPYDPMVLAWTHTYMGYIALKENDLDAARASFDRALATVADGKVATMAREGLGKVDTIRMLMPGGGGPR